MAHYLVADGKCERCGSVPLSYGYHGKRIGEGGLLTVDYWNGGCGGEVCADGPVFGCYLTYCK